ncbi:condensation domain-containing protein, partial [Paractinoplanes brasiliensis]
LEISQLFDSPTVAGLSAALGSAAGARPPLTAGPRPERLPLSFAQQRLWFLNRLDGLSPAYNVPVALRLTGPLDVRALEAAFADVTDRHETLRTVFADDADGSHQLVLPSVRTAVPVLPVAERELAERVSEVAGRGFDLAEEPPLRATVLRLAADRHVLVLVLHHIAGDGGWSAPVLVRDLLTAYAARTAGTEPDWKPLPVQYADYTLWQRKVLGSEEDPDSPISRQLSYWRQALDGLPDELALPRDRPRPLQAGHHGDEVPFVIPAELRRALDRTAAEQHVSIFMVVQAALAVLLSRLGAGADIPIGTPIAGRTDESLEDLVGFFLN